MMASPLPQAAAPAPARPETDGEAGPLTFDPLDPFRKATKQEKVKAGRQRRAAYQPGAGPVKARRRPPERATPKREARALDVARFRRAVSQGDVDGALSQLGSWANQSTSERCSAADQERRRLAANDCFRNDMRTKAAARVERAVEEAQVLTALPSVDAFFAQSRAFEASQSTSSCPTKSDVYRGAVPRRRPPRSPVKKSTAPTRCDALPDLAPAPVAGLWWGPAEAEASEAEEEAVHFWGHGSDSETESEAEPWLSEPELLLSAEALREQQQGAGPDARAAALHAQAAERARVSTTCARHARAVSREAATARRDYARSILDRYAARWLLVGARHGVAAAMLRWDAAIAAQDGVAAPFDRLIAKARVVVADEQERVTRAAAPRGNVAYTRRAVSEDQLRNAEAVEAELRARKRDALQTHAGRGEACEDGVRAAEAAKEALTAAHSRAAGRSGMHRFATRLVGRARRRIKRRRLRLLKVAKVQAVQRGLAIRTRHRATPGDEDSYRSYVTRRSARSAATAPSHVQSAASPLRVPSTVAPQPAPLWVRYYDDAARTDYFYNIETGATSWEQPAERRSAPAPAPAPAPATAWRRYVHGASGKPYWRHAASGETTWDDSAGAAPAPAPAPAPAARAPAPAPAPGPAPSLALVPYSWRRGDACLALWDDGLWYDARIADYGDHDDTFDVLYKDGDFRSNVPLQDLAPLDQRDFLDDASTRASLASPAHTYTGALVPLRDDDYASFEDFGERSLVLSDLDYGSLDDGSRVPDADEAQGLEWETAADEAGRTYYFNRLTGESSWERPRAQSPPPPEHYASPPPPREFIYDEESVSTVHIDEYGVIRAQPSQRAESFRSYSSRASSRWTTPRSRNTTPRSHNPYRDEGSYDPYEDPEGPTLSRVPSNASNYSYASSTG